VTTIRDEWADVDRCLDWLNEQIGWERYEYGASALGGYYVDTDTAGESVAPTLHAALIAACQAVQETQP